MKNDGNRDIFRGSCSGVCTDVSRRAVRFDDLFSESSCGRLLKRNSLLKFFLVETFPSVREYLLEVLLGRRGRVGVEVNFSWTMWSGEVNVTFFIAFPHFFDAEPGAKLGPRSVELLGKES